MTETPIHFFQTDNSKKRKRVTLCAHRGKSSDCCGISIFERQKKSCNEPKLCTYCTESKKKQKVQQDRSTPKPTTNHAFMDESALKKSIDRQK